MPPKAYVVRYTYTHGTVMPFQLLSKRNACVQFFKKISKFSLKMDFVNFKKIY